MQENYINLKANTGTLVIPMGFIRVSVWFKGKMKIFKLCVIKKGGPPIMSYDWIKSFSLVIYLLMKV